MRIAVVTPVSGRHRHLALQRRGLERGRRQPDLHVVVAMADRTVPSALTGPVPTAVTHIGTSNGKLPLAQARNTGAATAIAHGADLLVFLDVDCIPDENLVERYADCAASPYGAGLLCGAVDYLPPPPPEGYHLDELAGTAKGHPARPVAPNGTVLTDGDHALFWSLSFAVTVATWRTVGGFDESYVGYGGEDTDFGQRAAAAGVPLHWVGGAWAYHQFHPTADPPTQHVHDIVGNAAIFRRRWGWWPMLGWLRGFAELGLARYDAVTDSWSVTSAAPAPIADPGRDPTRPGPACETPQRAG